MNGGGCGVVGGSQSPTIASNGAEYFGVSYSPMPTYKWADALERRNRRPCLKLVDMDTLAELQLVTQDEIVVLFRRCHVTYVALDESYNNSSMHT
ncbi:unnamed protein product [Sphagnum balticum]